MKRFHAVAEGQALCRRIEIKLKRNEKGERRDEEPSRTTNQGTALV
jgi:hypothetical protein